MLKTALLEIGTEELPSSYIEPALAQMKQAAEGLLNSGGLSYSVIKTYATPRRLAIVIEKLAEKSVDRSEDFTGPSLKAGRDAKGDFTQAAKGFASKYGTTPDKLTVKDTERGEYLCCTVKTPGEKTEKLLSLIFLDVIKEIKFPKSMVWEPSGFRFARPVRTLVALYDSKVIKMQVGGVKASKKTAGLHTLTQKMTTVGSADKYLVAMKNSCIIANQEERREILKKIIEQAAKRAKGSAITDEGLLNEVNYLVEHPVAIVGSFDEKYLALPPEVLITCMRKKQKYFPVTDSKKHLLNCFIGIRNGMSEFQETVREGYERVLRARLDDAEFFFRKDTVTRLESKVEKLKGVMFQKELGTVYDKSGRVEKIAEYLLSQLPGGNNIQPLEMKQACALAKADLVTEMVFEFPELQGVIGRIYALKDGEQADVARAVEEHYWPVTADGKLPASDFGAVLSIADKMDTLAGDFAAGLIPSGSADPYGLRRQCVGVLRIIREKRLPIRIRVLIEKAFSFLPENLKFQTSAQKQVEDFMKQRLEGILEAAGYKFDEVRAVLGQGNIDDISDIESRLAALKAMRKLPGFDPLITAFKRSANILRQAEKLKLQVAGIVDESLFKEDAEKNLYLKINSMRADIDALKSQKNYPEVLQKMVGIKPDVDEFFDKVMVMVEETDLKLNRLALLKYTTGMFSDLMDFSQLQD